MKAAQSNGDDHPTIASLYSATYGILFFATPQKGLIVADIKKMLVGDSRHPRHTLLEEIDKNSSLLRYQLPAFKSLVRDRKTVSFSRLSRPESLPR